MQTLLQLTFLQEAHLPEHKEVVGAYLFQGTIFFVYAPVHRSLGSQVIVRMKSPVLLNLLGNGGRILTKWFGNVFHGHILVKTFFNTHPIIKG